MYVHVQVASEMSMKVLAAATLSTTIATSCVVAMGVGAAAGGTAATGTPMHAPQSAHIQAILISLRLAQ